ncbi:MAG: hypothetical protein AB7E46_06110 [Desulfovibrio sp.]
MAIEMHSPQKAVGSARRTLLLGDACSVSETRFELLRATVWGLTTRGTLAHVTKILNATIPSWRLLSKRYEANVEELRAELRDSLTLLQDAGDLIEVGGGQWVPATTRLVRLSDYKDHMIVGGAPTYVLPVTATAVHHHGPYRHVIPDSKLQTTLPVEDVTDWARLPDIPLSEWAQILLSSLATSPYTPTSTESFEFYQPATTCAGTPQFKRWSEDIGKTTGLLLARRTRLYGAKEFRLVDVSSGHIVRACELPISDVRRLMYFLDLEAGNSVHARTRTTGEVVEFLLSSEIPRPEQRIFAALGTLDIPVERFYERKWTFNRGQKRALGLLRSLGIQLKPMPHEVRL